VLGVDHAVAEGDALAGPEAAQRDHSVAVDAGENDP
jgi:hypothetical protein